jgi:molecular chaperone GrpE
MEDNEKQIKEKIEKTIELTTDLINNQSDNVNELDLLNDKFLRKCAEFENYKRRVQKEKEEIKFNTKVNMVTSILDIDNDISIAIKNIKDESAKEGVILIAQKLENFLKSQGIESIQTEIYDDEIHEVISVLPTGKSEIIDVISKGYMLNGKPFRHPKIVIGK